MATYRIAVLPGDGIGQEVTPEAVRVLKAVGKGAGVGFEFEPALVGGAAIDATGGPLAPGALALCRKAQAILFGAVGGPKWENVPHEVRAERRLLAIRKELDLYANLRPAVCFPFLVDASPLKRSVVEGTDLMVIRELTGGLYYGEPRGVERFADGGARAVNTMVYTTREIERIARTAFEVARKRRKRLASVDKANVLVVSQLWREVVTRVARDYPDVTLEHVLVDNCAMALVHRPSRFDTIVTENTFGDILSDEAAILAGSSDKISPKVFSVTIVTENTFGDILSDEPARIAASSDKISPKVFSVTIVSNRDGRWTSAIAQLSTRTCSSVTSG